jgi:hypothetical protein
VRLSAKTAFLLACLVFGCIPPPEKPIDPRVLFTAGSSFLQDVSTLALKGKIEFQSERLKRGGSFELFLSGTDSLAFIVEGTFGLDLFRLLIIGEEAFATSNGWDDWQAIEKGETLSVPEWGIDKFSPYIIGPLVFPQYYFSYLDWEGALEDIGHIKQQQQEFILTRSENLRGFTITEESSGILAYYSNLKKIDGGFFPSKAQISSFDSDWRIVIEIAKIRKNLPNVPTIWDIRH